MATKAKKYYVVSDGPSSHLNGEVTGIYSSPARVYEKVRKLVEQRSGQQFHRAAPEITGIINKRTGEEGCDFPSEGIFTKKLREDRYALVYYDVPSEDGCDRFVVEVTAHGLNV